MRHIRIVHETTDSRVWLSLSTSDAQRTRAWLTCPLGQHVQSCVLFGTQAMQLAGLRLASR